MPKVELNLEDDELKELLLGDRDKAMQSIMAKILDEILKSEATEQIKAKAYERSDERTNSRNGYRVRQLTTRVGSLELHVPKLRHGNFSTQLFKRYQRSEQAFDLALMEMVIQGVSTRKVAEITKKLCGTTFSKSTVSALCNNLDDQVLDFNRRPLTQKYAFVYADAILFKVHRGHVVTSNSLLVAMESTLAVVEKCSVLISVIVNQKLHGWTSLVNLNSGALPTLICLFQTLIVA